MKRKWIAAFLTCVMVFALSVTAFAATPAATAAQKLDDLGLFEGVGGTGSTPNYDLNRAPTRAEAVTMLVRLLGKEKEAQNSSYSAPFTDVADWANPDVNYAYKNGLTNGTSATTFSGWTSIKPTEYLTFVLRALGYTSGTDFQWNSAWTLTDKLGITQGQYNANTAGFSRGNVASISFDALSASKKNTTTPLYQSLINAGVFTEAQAKTAGLVKEEAKVEVTSVKLNRSSVTLKVDETVTLSATVSPSNAMDKSVTWSSSRTSVATVSSSGRVTAEGEGTATITAKTANGKTATCTVKVEKTVIEPTSVSVSPSRLTLKEGESDTLSASVRPTNATETWVDWESSDTRVARVSSSGRVTAVSEGTARITATTDNGRSDYCTVTVEKGEPELEFSVPKLNYNYGPMTITEYRSNKVEHVNRVESLVFTDAKINVIDQAELSMNVKGTTDYTYCVMRLHFIDGSGKVIEEKLLTKGTQPNQPYNLLFDVDIDPEILAQTEAIEFYSYSGAKATDGISGGTTTEPTDPEEPEDSEEMEQILTIAKKLESHLVVLMDDNGKLKSALDRVVKGVKEFDAQNPHSATQYMLFAAQDLRAVEEHINGLVTACGDHPDYATAKEAAQQVVSSYEQLLKYCDEAAQETEDAASGGNLADLAEGSFETLLQNIRKVIQAGNNVLIQKELEDRIGM